MYERVPRNRPPLLQHLDDPVVSSVPHQLNMIRSILEQIYKDYINIKPKHFPDRVRSLALASPTPPLAGKSCKLWIVFLQVAFFASCVFLQVVFFFKVVFFCKLCFFASCVFFASCIFLQVGDYTRSGELPTMTCPSEFGRTHFAEIMKSSHSGLSSQLTA